ncbi:dynein heavy chain and region D6 of dynein motor-domain-containing protein, partial [Dunaliella salina]
MEAVCVLLDAKPTMVADPNTPGKKVADYWDASKKLLMDTRFIDHLKEYDRDNIQPRIMEKVRKEYVANPEFTPQNASKASSAAEGLCKWVHAMNSYDRVAKVVAPKREKLKEAEASYRKVMEGLQEKQEELNKLMMELATLEARLSNSMEEKDRLEKEVEKCRQKLERAQELISGLGGEKDRWMEAAHALRGQFGGIMGDMLLSAAVISYLGAFTAPFRDESIAAWIKACKKVGVAISPKYSLAGALAEPVRVRSWVIAGLPNDAFSIDNAIMLTNARRWPLCIDPQKQANKWIKNSEAANKLSVVKLTDPDYMRTLENSIAFGLPVLMENVGEELDACLDPLLLKQTFKQAGTVCIKLGDNTVEYSKDFRFYITTVLRNPHYLPETAVKVTLLNFMITQEGLADQLLGVVVAQEMPDLEEQRQQLVVSSAENKRKLKEIEDQILEVLSKSQGNILEDVTAVQVLSEAKQISNDITQKQAVAEETQGKIDVARRGYRPCGEYNAILFFCIADLGGIDTMYQYSLSWFIGLFVRAITQSAPSDALTRRLEAINNLFTYMLYTNVCRSLFEKDKLLFAFLLATRIMRQKKVLPSHEYDYLATGGASAIGHSDKSLLPNPDPTWISAKAWAELGRLGSISEAFGTLQGHMALSKVGWRQALYDSPNPHLQPFPEPFNSSLSAFQRLLLLRVLRPDKFVPAVAEFVSASLGSKFTQPPPFDLAAAYAESSSSVPLLFVLSPGTDPTAALMSFAESRGMAGPGRFMVISMGQGQGPKAAAMLEDARSLGAWVMLQNCHLAPSWMSTLERQCEALSESSTDEGFRLWMSCMPSPAFPPSVLQNCVKMTNEPPAGLKHNMRRCLALEPLNDPAFWEEPAAVQEEPPPASRAKKGVRGAQRGGAESNTHGDADAGSAEPQKKPVYTPEAKAVKRLLFGLVFIHACVQERRRFGPIGWNIPYGFDDGDLRISARQARMYVLNASGKEVPFAALQYSVGECNYGGRVTDDKDRRLLTTILSRIYRPELLEGDTFQLTESGTYFVPRDGPLAAYESYVDQLPSEQAPEAFGLHANADISKDLAATEELLAS